MSLCEVRIPTYKRPDLLDRALKSLIAQTHQNWLALVLDDSPAQEAKIVVEALNDSRIIYQPHKTNLGRSKNIDYAFYSNAYVCGSYAFVLEDDNYLFPEFIAQNIQSVETNNVGIVLRNQEVRLETNGASVPTGATTREKWFQKGVYNPLELKARLFFSEGISNGGLFWHTERIKSNLQVGSQVEHSWHQELFRTLRVEEAICFEPTPQCVFTEFERSYRKINLAPKHNRGTQSILIYLIHRYGNDIISEAEKIALNSGSELLLERKLLNALQFKYKFKQIGKLETINLSAKYLLRYLLYRDPFKEILVV